MAESVFSRVRKSCSTNAMTRPEILDMAGSGIPDTSSRKKRRRRTQAIANLFEINRIVFNCDFLQCVFNIMNSA